MKKIFISIFLFILFTNTVFAKGFEELDYNNIPDEGKIKFENDIWVDNVLKKEDNYFIKIIHNGLDYFYNSDGTLALDTGCNYEFIYKNSLIGYSNSDLKFYEINIVDNSMQKRELSEQEIQEIFPEFKIIKITDFSADTNSLKVQRDNKFIKLILLNDTEADFQSYNFYYGNVKLRKYSLKGFLKVISKGLVQFSSSVENDKKLPWYVIIVK